MPENTTTGTGVPTYIPVYFRDVTGKEWPLVKITWGKERQLLKILIEAVNKLNESPIDIDLSNLDPVKLFNVLTVASEVAPEALSSMTAILLDTSPKEIDDNFDLAGIMEVLIYFFGGLRRSFQARLPQLTQIIQKLREKTAAFATMPQSP